MKNKRGDHFKKRLSLLLRGERPYTWARKAGIEKGLFQYYWGKGKIPTLKNLLKIQNQSKCSLDWLLTGRIVDIHSIDLAALNLIDNGHKQGRRKRLIEALEKIRLLYADGHEKDIRALEYLVESILEAEPALSRSAQQIPAD